MTDLRMYTQEEVAEMLHTHIGTITILREIDILPAIRTGKNYMITKESIMEFQKNYAGLDVSNPNRVKAIEAYRLVKNRLVIYVDS